MSDAAVTMLTDEELAAMRARADAANPLIQHLESLSDDETSVLGELAQFDAAHRDVAAAVRTDVPRLLAEVERLRSILAAATEVHFGRYIAAKRLAGDNRWLVRDLREHGRIASEVLSRDEALALAMRLEAQR